MGRGGGYQLWYECEIQKLRMDTNVMNFIKVGFDCLSDLDTKVKDGYECYEFDIGLVWLFISYGYKC